MRNKNFDKFEEFFVSMDVFRYNIRKSETPKIEREKQCEKHSEREKKYKGDFSLIPLIYY